MLGVGRRQVLNRVVREGLMEEVMFKQRPEGMKKLNHVDIWRRIFQAERTSAKALGQGNACCVVGIARRPHGWDALRTEALAGVGLPDHSQDLGLF